MEEEKKEVCYTEKVKLHNSSIIPLSNLRQLKTLRGLSYGDLAKMTGLGYSKEYYHKTLKGYLNPKPEVKTALGVIFGVDPLRVSWGIVKEEVSNELDKQNRGGDVISETTKQAKGEGGKE